MKTVVGPIAEGDNYLDRPELETLFWRKIEQSHHLSITAPRRVGKTSFMIHLAGKEYEKYDCRYLITESVNETNEFFKKLYKVLLETLSKGSRLKQFFDDLFKRLKIKKVSLTEIEFDNNTIDYYNEILLLCREAGDIDKIVVLLIDEFSQTLENIVADQGPSAAKLFLHKCRELRQEATVKSKVYFIYSGSIGLENIVFALNEPRSISDVRPFSIPPFTQKEAGQLILKIIDGDTITFKKQYQDYFLQKLNWLLPYFIQLLMSEMEDLLVMQNSNEINKAIIDDAFNKALNNRSYFEHWLTRLRTVFKGPEFSCAKEILNRTAKTGGIDKARVHDLAAKYEVADVRNVLNILEHDGYLSWNEKNTQYRFNSPLLQAWWMRNIVV